MKRNRFFVGGILGTLAALVLQVPISAGEGVADTPTPVTLGEKIFADRSLSASGDLACATCHDPTHAHAQCNDLPVQRGGGNRDVHGFRAVPSLRYLSFTQRFGFDADGTPVG